MEGFGIGLVVVGIILVLVFGLRDVVKSLERDDDNDDDDWPDLSPA